MINKHISALTLLLFSVQFIMAQRIVINFDAAPNTPPSVSKAILRYDKDFAYSLTFDDATDDGYTCALPALQGGLSACSGTTVSPLFYTDGCGNNLLFKAGIAWNSANFYGIDNHVGNVSGMMLWTQLDDLLAKDWDVLNHSFSHKARWIQAMTGADYINEIVKNRAEVKLKTAKNYDSPIFVVPSGDTYYQDIAYDQGQELVLDQSANTIGRGGLVVNTDFSPNGGVLHRQSVEDALNSGQDIIGGVASRSAAGQRLWYNEFAHKLDGSSGLSFSNFRNHVERIANTWGKNGNDRIWVAGLQEVYEYLTVRKTINYTATVNGNQLIIDFDLQSLPTWLRRKPLTLVVNSSTSFSTVTTTQGVKMTYKGTGAKKIINLDFAGASSSNPCDNDVTPPALTACPPNISLMTTTTTAATTWTAPTATDNCSPPSVTSNFSSGQSFPLGTTTVIYTATDAKNNSKTCSFTVVVTQIIVNPCNNDITPPVLSACPQNISLTTSGTSAIATWTPPTATDNCTPPPSVTSNFSSGQSFPLGTTTVIYTATDAKNNSKTCSFTIIVSNTQNNLDLAVSLATTPNPVTRPYTYATYRITLNNLSGQSCSNILVTFPFPQGLVNGGIPKASVGTWREYCPNSRICYEWTIDNLAVNGTATLDIPLFVLGLSSPITATAKLVSSIPADNNAANNQASVTIGGNTTPALSANAKPSQLIPIVIHKIIPNPSEGDLILVIESIQEREATFNVSDAFGKVVRTETQKVVKGSNRLLFDMWLLPQGLYFITPTTSLGRGMPIKFVKL